MPALFCTIGLIIALLVQTIASSLAAAWLFFHLMCCTLLIYKSGGVQFHGLVRQATLAWLLLLGISTFIFTPIAGAAAFMWVLAAMPMLALCLKPEHLKSHLIGFSWVITLYSIGVIIQSVLGVTYTHPNFSAHVWPILDANNAAVVINFGLITSFYFALKRPKWWLWFALFAAALVVTKSRAGMGAAGISCAILAASQIGFGKVLKLSLLPLAGVIAYVFSIHFNTESLWQRLDIWNNCLEIAKASGFTGYGFGSFPYLYAWVKQNNDPNVWFAHNDLLQFIIEGGWILALGFIGLVCAVILRTTKANLLPACIMLAVFIQSMFEFQFYMPVISILMGLPLAYHMNKKPIKF
jgi:O-antigen ligase